MKFRQIRNIVIMIFAILLAIATLLIIYVAMMEEEIDEAFPSAGSDITVSESGSVISETTDLSSDPTESTGPAPSDETTVAPETTAPVGGETNPLFPDDPPPEEDVFINMSTLLQTVSHEQRDIAYGKLKQDVRKYISDATGTRIGFYYINLKNNEEFGTNELAPYVVGSSINLPINLVLYDTAINQSLSFKEVMAYGEGDKTEGSGTIKNEAYGSQYYIRELSRLSITAGDNVATAMLLRRLGGIEVVSEEFRKISGIIDFVKVHKYTDYSGAVLSGAYRSGVLDLARYAEALYYRYMVDPEEYQMLMNDLAHTESAWGVAAQFPEGTQVFHKTGSNNTYHCETDIAIIICEEPIVLCVSAEANTAAEAREIQSALGKMVQEYISSCYA